MIGCGGYASFAVVRAAQQMGIPTVLLEVNALPGKVTQMLAKRRTACWSALSRRKCCSAAATRWS